MVDLPDKKGDTLFGKYRIIASLGKGGYSQVWLAEHVKLRCLRAVKVIRKDNFLYERLLNEANVLKMLNHQCIPTIYDIEEDEKCAYIIEEYCQGRSLKSEKRLVKHFHENSERPEGQKGRPAHRGGPGCAEGGGPESHHSRAHLQQR